MTTTMGRTGTSAGTRRAGRRAGWILLAGGVFFLAGGPLHPHEDPPGVSVKEHMRIMFDDPSWYPAHIVLLIGMAGIAAALVMLARSQAWSAGSGPSAPADSRDGERGRRYLRAALVVAGAATVVATPAMLLHLIAALDAGRIAAHHATPLTDVQVVVETVTVPIFGLSIAVLAVIGALSRTLGNWIAAVFGVLGGVGYAIAGATFLFTEATDPLFPTAAGIALWAVIAGIGLLRRRPARP
jgi:hypothetical protein